MSFEKIGGGEVVGYGDGEGVDEFAGVFGNDLSAEDAAGWLFAEEADETVFGFHEDGLAVVVEGIVGGDVVDAAFVERFLGESDASDLGVGKDDVEHVVVVERAEDAAGFGEGVTGGVLALEDGGVYDLEGAGAVACGVDVGVGGELVLVGFDLAVGEEFDAGGFEPEIGGIGRAAHGVDDVLGGDGFFEAFVIEDRFEAGVRFFDTLEGCAGVEVESFVAEGFFNGFGYVGSLVLEDVGAALDLGDLGSDAVEELGELAGDDSAAEYDGGFGEEIEVEHVVAGPDAFVVEAGYRWNGYFRAGADNELLALKLGAVGEFDGVGADEFREGAVEVVLAAAHGIDAVVCELLNGVDFALVQGLHIDGSAGNVEAEFFGVLGEVEDFGGVDEGFGGHAAAQDAESAELLGSVDDSDAVGDTAGDAGCVEAAGAAADGNKVVGFHDTGERV